MDDPKELVGGENKSKSKEEPTNNYLIKRCSMFSATGQLFSNIVQVLEGFHLNRSASTRDENQDLTDSKDQKVFQSTCK